MSVMGYINYVYHDLVMIKFMFCLYAKIFKKKSRYKITIYCAMPLYLVL